MSLLTIGTIAYDSIATPFGKADKALGGSATYFSLAARFFSPTAVVAVVGEDFAPQDERVFAEHKVDTQGLVKAAGKTFAWGGRYGFDLNNRETLFTHLNVLEHFSPQVPVAHRRAEFVFLGNIHPHLQKQVLAQLTKPGFVACDTMNYWIEHNREELLEVLNLVQGLVINDSELRELTQEFNLIKGAKKLLSKIGQNKILVVKRGEYGVLLFYSGEIFYLPGYPLEEVFDPTGAGDSFAGGFMGYLAAKKNFTFGTLKQACVVGSVLGSFCVEKMGTERLQTLTQQEIANRLAEFKKLTQFEAI